MFPYTTYKSADLKRMLRQRNLRTYGAKAALTSRLAAHDMEHPFRFLDLPAEIRNEIYQYTADMVPSAPKKPKKPATSNAAPTASPSFSKTSLQKKNQTSIQHPALFLTCSQIRAESRLMFYRRHTFKLHLWRDEEDQSAWRKWAKWLHVFQAPKTCLERATGWLEDIGEQARRQIRRVEIEMHCDGLGPDAMMKEYKPFIDALHARLTDDVTVIYRVAHRDLREEIQLLWELGKTLYSRELERVPGFEWQPHRIVYPGDDNPWVAPWIRVLRAGGSRARPSLTLEPGRGWFGGRARRSVGYWERKWF